MITANKGYTKVAGINLNIIFEFNSIVAALQEDHPEIVLGVLTAWSDILDEKLESISDLELTAIVGMSEDYIKLHKESEDKHD